MTQFPVNVYFYSAYVPATREGIHGIIPAVCSASARDVLRREHPGTKYLSVSRIPELRAQYDPSAQQYRIEKKERRPIK